MKLLTGTVAAAVAALASSGAVSGVSGPQPLYPTVVFGMSAGLGDGVTVHRLDKIRNDLNLGGSGKLGLVRARLYLPGSKIVYVVPLKLTSPTSCRTTETLTPGGLSWSFSHCPRGQSPGLTFDAKVVAPVGSRRCPKVVVSLWNGKTGTFTYGCYTVGRPLN